MILDFHEYDPEGRYDCCIVGSGPAGLSLALKLARHNKRILILEAGGEDLSAQSQEIYKGRITGDVYHPLDTARLRYLGGTSNHWGGWARPLDEFDFETKPYRPLACWPIGKSDLDLYLDEAKEILGIDTLPRDEPLDDSLQEIGFAIKPVRFSAKYRETLEQSKDIHLFLNANVTALRTNGKGIGAVEVAGWSGRQLKAIARDYVLATGGIENSRLLLWSNQLSNGALLAAGSPVGRYWMEHPHFTIGQLLLFGKDPFRKRQNGVSFLSPTRKSLLEDKALNCGLRLVPVNYSGTKEMIAELACVAPATARWAALQLRRNLVCGLKLHAAWEQEPHASSRVELSDNLDRFGVPRVDLRWKKSKYDIRTARVAGERLGRYVANQDIGRVQLDDWVVYESGFPTDDEIGGFHHMGGTRMAASSSDGVVDANCKVFGLDNLYVAGSSVFPAGGHANPTFTILQLALRLADHLLQR